MVDDDFLYQHKEMCRSHTIKKLDLEELRRNAIDESKHSVYIVEYNEPHRRWFMISENDWNDINEHLRQSGV